MRPIALAATLLTACLGLSAAEGVPPFADKPCDSYSAFTTEDGKPGMLLWGKAPLKDFGSRPVTFDSTGVRQLRPAPPPGVHPRICFGPDDLPAVRQRINDTRCGQAAWKNILCWTEMMKGLYDDSAEYAKPDRWNGGFGGLHSRVPLYRLGVPGVAKGATYNRNPNAAATWAALIDGSASAFPPAYWNTMALEAFRCLIVDDAAGAADCAKAVVTAMKLEQAKRDREQAEQSAKKPDQPVKPPAGPVGGFQLAFSYDFLFNHLTAAQKTAIHDELAASTWSHDNYGTFNTAEGSRSNWATFSYWLYHVLAIEGEPGFNELKVRGMYRGWRNLLTYGWLQSGATWEGEAKNQLGMDGVLMFAMRAGQYGFENLGGHPYLRAYVHDFLPHSTNAMLTGFHRYDLLGGSRAKSGAAAPMDSLGLKFMFPEDKRVDWYFRLAMGPDYENVPDRPDGYYNALLFFAIFATDYDPANNDPKALNLGNTFFCGERAMMMTRSAWEPSAMQLNLHVRQANGGHPFADRNAIMVAGAGRIWSPNGYSSFLTCENSVVCIDGQSQSTGVPGRLVGFEDQPLATFAIGDASYCWDWNWRSLNKPAGYYTAEDVRGGKVAIPPGCEPELHTENDFAFTKLPYAYLNRPLTERAHWLLPAGAVSPVVREPRFPVLKALRTAGLVRGAQPYAVVVDDIRKDDAPHRYDWTLALEPDIQIAKVDQRADGVCDILLTGADPEQTGPRGKEPLPATLATDAAIPAGQPMLLVRVLHGASTGDLAPTIVELPNGSNPKKYGLIRRLIVASQSIEPGFKVLLVPHRQGEAVPATTWHAARGEATVGADSIRFTAAGLGKTDVVITRAGRQLIALTRPPPPFPDVQEEQRAVAAKAARERVKNFKPESLAGLVPLPSIEGVPSSRGTTGQTLAFSGATEPVSAPIDLKAIAVNGFTVAFWVQSAKPTGTLIDCSGYGNHGLSLSFESGNLRTNAAGQWRWQGNVAMSCDWWRHLATTCDGRSLTLYLDGQPVRTSPIDKPLNLAPAVKLGGGFTGRLEDLRIYNRALAAGEVLDLVDYQRHVLGQR